jgi:CheY-like chemotaxis protein
VAAARAALGGAAFDALVVDCGLPDGDGCDVARALRASEEPAGGARTRIVALTARPDVATHARCLAAGMDACLVKPADVEDLRAALAPAIEAAHLALLAQLDDDAPGLVARVAEEYTRDTLAHLALVRRACAAGDADAVVRAAHRVHGASASAGAALAAALAQAVERAAGAGVLPDVDLVAALERAVNAAAAELRQAAERGASPAGAR